jgi:hypothetical protein
VLKNGAKEANNFEQVPTSARTPAARALTEKATEDYEHLSPVHFSEEKPRAANSYSDAEDEGTAMVFENSLLDMRRTTIAFIQRPLCDRPE